MNKLYNGPTWHNNTNPALNETNLNILGQAVDDIDDRVIAIAGTVMETVPQVQEDLAEAQELLEDAEAINSHPPIIGQNGNWWTWDTSTNAYVDSGKDASVTVSVNPNTETLPAGSNAYVRNVGTSTDPVLLFGIPKGDKGETGGATPGSDISGTVVDTITASTAEYPEIAASDTMKVITGKIKKFLDDLKTKKADKVTSATNGHLAGLDSNGNLTDSGSKASDFLTSHQTIKQDGVTGATVNRFGTCSTAAGTAAKTVSITSGTFSLEAGARVSVKFNNANTASTPTLNVNSTGAKNIYHKGSQITSGDNKALLAGTVDFIYDGTQWQLVGNNSYGSIGVRLGLYKLKDYTSSTEVSLSDNISNYKYLGVVAIGIYSKADNYWKGILDYIPSEFLKLLNTSEKSYQKVVLFPNENSGFFRIFIRYVSEKKLILQISEFGFDGTSLTINDTRGIAFYGFN